jgi:hypothetical protein
MDDHFYPRPFTLIHHEFINDEIIQIMLDDNNTGYPRYDNLTITLTILVVIFQFVVIFAYMV